MILTTTLTDDFKLVVPKEVREAAGWQPGQLLLLDVFGSNVDIKASTAELLVAFKETDLETEADIAAPGGPEPDVHGGPEGNPIEALRGLMVGKQVEEFVRDGDDRY